MAESKTGERRACAGLGPQHDRTESRADSLRCVGCGQRVPLGDRAACGRCASPLVVEYDLEDLRGTAPATVFAGRDFGLWRYEELLPPVFHRLADRLWVPPTPLRPAPALAEAFGLRELWVKEDHALPTGSFKDRPASVAVAWAAGRGYRAVGCASTGNLAAATARAAAVSRMPAIALVPAGLPSAKLDPVYRFGGRVVEVTGPYDAANRVANLLAESAGVGFVNVSLRPVYTEGSKSLTLEVLEAFGWESPDALVVPLGSGALLSATARAIAQLRELEWLTSAGPRLFGSQPEGCAPIVEAFHRGETIPRPIEHPDTIAESLAIGDPASGPEALRAIRGSGGEADAPSRLEVEAAIREAARLEGIWVEPAAGTVLATIRRKVESGAFARSDRVVAYLTGAGWKAPHIALPHPRAAETVRFDPIQGDPDSLVGQLGLPPPREGPW